MSDGAEHGVTPPPPPRPGGWRRFLLIVGMILLYTALLSTGVLSFLLVNGTLK